MRPMPLTCMTLLMLTGPAIAAELETEQQKLSYSIGASIGQSLETGFDTLDIDALLLGLRDALTEQPLRLTKQQMGELITRSQLQQLERQRQQRQQLAAENQRRGERFLAENRAKEGIQTAASGLQYRVLEPGDGDRPSATSTVTVHYEGRRLDGTVFDSSYQRGEPARMPLDRTIAGWSEALQKMPRGARYELYLPAELAYGEKGNSRIGPNEVLIFKVELIDIVN